MPLGFEQGVVEDSQLTEEEEGDSQLSLYSLIEIPSSDQRAPSWSPLTQNEMAPASSPLSSAPPSQSQTKPTSSNPDPRLPHYRPAKPIPFELAEHVLIYFEESLHMQAFNLLTSLLSSGASSANLNAPASVPSPSHLALTATLCVHPRMTTRTISRDHHEAANEARRLLRLTHKVLGPINGNFATAFEFKHYDHVARSRIAHSDSSQPDIEPEAPIDSPYADAGSVFSLAEDFWHVVGWAFNCACLPDMYAARWSQWHLWLDFMLSILESDWELRFHNNTVEDSLILQFIESATSGYGRDRRIMRAIFADGSPKSLNEFKPIFKHELKPPKSDTDQPKKREVEKLDIDAEVYGDYMAPDDDEDGDEDYSQNSRPAGKTQRTRTPSTRRITPRNSNQSLREDFDSGTGSNTTSTLGSPKALSLRIRLLHLLSHISGCPATLPSFLEIPELYTLFIEFIKPLPISLFASVLTTTARLFSSDAHSTLVEKLLQRTLETSFNSDERFLTRTKLVESYLPFAASRSDVPSNAKVSICLEALVRSLKRAGLLGGDRVDVQRAVRMGVERRGRVLKRGKKEEEELAGKMLRESGRRMMWSVGIEVDAEEEDDIDSDTIVVAER
jgi:hypothetical protein